MCHNMWVGNAMNYHRDVYQNEDIMLTFSAHYISAETSKKCGVVESEKCWLTVVS